jgi:serine/alanine adding enzyme
MKIIVCRSEAEGNRWQNYVDSQAQSTHCHRWNWKSVIENSFGWPTYYLMAEEDSAVQGILPVVRQKSWLFGSFLSSLPYLNAGGILANTESAKKQLLASAIDLSKRVRADHLELRHRDDQQLGLVRKTNKVTVMLPLDPNPERLWKALDTKIRTKVRKSQSFGMRAEFGGEDFLQDFYSVFCENMRDLGTPVYSPRFFREILHAFPDTTHICRIRYNGRTIATSFMCGYRDCVEATWSASLKEYLKLKPNMFLYWNLFCYAAQRGYRIFDFGRSTVDSGTHVFKMQWGSQTVPLHWDYWLPNGRALPEINPQNPKYRFAIRLWQKLPLKVANRIGPPIVRCLP